MADYNLLHTGEQLDAAITNHVDTSDADAVAGDILSGKTAYVNKVKLTGTATGGSGVQTCIYGSMSGNGGSSIAIGGGTLPSEPLGYSIYISASTTSALLSQTKSPASTTTLAFTRSSSIAFSTGEPSVSFANGALTISSIGGYAFKTGSTYYWVVFY